MEMKQIFGQNLKKYRKARGLKQSELAQMLGVSMYTVSVWERGKQMPEVKSIEALSQIFSVPPRSLYTEDGEGDSEDGEDERKKPAELFAKRIRELRKQKGMTQGTLAEALGISKFTVCGWERGLRCPECSTVAALADFFGVPERYFFSDVDEPPVTDVEKFLTKKVAGFLKEQFATTDFVGDYIISISVRKMEDAGSRTEREKRIGEIEERQGGAGDA